MATNRKIVPDTGKRVTLALRCRDCIHFKRVAYPSYGDVCENNGISVHTHPCNVFSIDSKLLSFNDGTLVEFARTVKGLPQKQLAIIAAILTREQTTRKQGFYFGQTVYVHMLSGKYLSNYAIAKVINADSTYVYVEGKKKFHAAVYHTNVIAPKDFFVIREYLQSKNKLIDPNLKRFMEKKSTLKVNDYTPPTIDQYQKFLDKSSVSEGRKKFSGNSKVRRVRGEKTTTTFADKTRKKRSA